MKTLFIAAALCAAALPATAQTSVSIEVGQPGFYGRIDLGNFRAPPVVYAEPIIIERRAHYVAEPVYLRVPPGHQKNWAKHCGRYNACGQRVLFVRDDWYQNTYVPRFREGGGGGHGDAGGHGRDHGGNDQGGNDHGGGKHKDKGGHGNGKGHGKNKD
jgi:uncharacterized membrane protein YgcG